MKKVVVFIFTALIIYGCGNKRGELIGVQQKKWFPEKPYGMTLVEGGAFKSCPFMMNCINSVINYVMC